MAGILALAGQAAAQRQPGWDVRVPDRIQLVAGTSGTLPIGLAVDRGLSISKDAAVILDLSPEGPVQVRRQRLGRADAVDPGADVPRFAVPLRADAPGDHAVKLRLRFWLCGVKVCRPVEATRRVIVAVEAPPAPSPGDAGVDGGHRSP